MKDFVRGLNKTFSSPNFIRFTLLFFVFESAWIALSATYPQAFDENFHFGLIQVYSHYWLPFLSSQPSHANAYGAVARDPSYLYHYLMSFPYRFIALFVHGQTGQVVLLRLINTAFFTVGLVLFRRILLRVGLSRSLSNVTILLFALVPIVPQLSAQINYDNMLIPLVAWVILLTFNFIDQLRDHKVSVRSLIILLSLCLLTSLVKYAFLPIFLGIVVFLFVVSIWKYHYKLRQLGSLLWRDWVRQKFRVRFLLLSLLILSLGMFIQRDGVNIIKYHSIAPSCVAVLNISDCKAYGTWYFSYTQHQIVTSGKANGTIKFMNPISYSLEWIYWMWYRLFFAVNGPNSSFTNYPPLPLPAAAAIFVAAGGFIVVVRWRRLIFHNNLYLTLLLFVSFMYILALFVQGYSVYHYTDILENMNGRYLLPVLIFLLAIIGRAFSIEFRNSVNRRMLITVVVLLLFLQGGGFLTYISRSDNTWYFQNTAVEKANSKAKTITKPLLIKGSKTYDTNIWFFN